MQFTRLTTKQEVLDLISYHNERSPYVVVDTETTGLNPRTAALIEFQMTGADGADSAVTIPAEFVSLLSTLVTCQVYQNFKYDYAVLLRHGVDLRKHDMLDTLILSHLNDENRLSHSLDAYVQERFGDTYKEAFWGKYKNYQDASLEDQLVYGCKDIVYTGCLFRELQESLRKQGIPTSLIRHVHDMALAVFDTEYQGILIDVPYLMEKGVGLKARIGELEISQREAALFQIEGIEMDLWEQEIAKRKTDRGKAGVPRPSFNFGSSKQLQALLYGKLKLPKQFNAKTKQISTDDEALEKLEGAHPVVKSIREYRNHCKVYNTYIEGTLEQMENGRLYPTLKVTGTVTGRLSHSNPNIAQVPRDGGIRGIYVPDPDHVFVSLDYGQIEIVIAAHFTGDKNLMKVVLEGASLHDVTAAGVGIERQLAKTLNFAEGYGCSHFKVAKILNCSVQEAEKVHKKYWETYKGQKQFMELCNKKIDDGLPIVNPFGRHRRFEKRSRSPWDSDYRKGYNSLIQGTGSDITSKAFYLVNGALKARNWGRGLFTVHDELVLHVKKETAEESQCLAKEIMESVPKEIGITLPLFASPSGPMERWLD